MPGLLAPAFLSCNSLTSWVEGSLWGLAFLLTVQKDVLSIGASLDNDKAVS